jgi:SIR2-like domain
MTAIPPSGTYEISKWADVEAWEDPRDILASQLRAGRFALVIGAGVSTGFGLPDWDRLIEALAIRFGKIKSPDVSNEDFSEDLWRAAGRDDLVFASNVRECLYDKYSLRMDGLSDKPLLASISAMARPAKRGSVVHIISFNFDDLIEEYLSYYGILVQSIAELPAWDSNLAAVKILHPHGLLPIQRALPVTPIIFTQYDYDRIVGDITQRWRSRLEMIMSSNTCLFLGLSGKDNNLMSIVARVGKFHVSKGRCDKFWGVRISCNENDIYRMKWEQRGICQYTLENYASLPAFLCEVCRRATALDADL